MTTTGVFEFLNEFPLSAAQVAEVLADAEAELIDHLTGHTSGTRPGIPCDECQFEMELRANDGDIEGVNLYEDDTFKQWQEEFPEEFARQKVEREARRVKCWNVDSALTHGEVGLALVYAGEPEASILGDGPDGQFSGTVAECVRWLISQGYDDLDTDDRALRAAWVDMHRRA